MKIQLCFFLFIFACSCESNSQAPTNEDSSQLEVIDFTLKEIDLEGTWYLFRIDLRNFDFASQTIRKSGPILKTQYIGDTCSVLFASDNRIYFNDVAQGLWTTQSKRLYLKRNDDNALFPIPLDMSYQVLLKSGFLLELESFFENNDEIKIRVTYHFRKT